MNETKRRGRPPKTEETVIKAKEDVTNFYQNLASFPLPVMGIIAAHYTGQRDAGSMAREITLDGWQWTIRPYYSMGSDAHTIKQEGVPRELEAAYEEGTLLVECRESPFRQAERGNRRTIIAREIEPLIRQRKAINAELVHWADLKSRSHQPGVEVSVKDEKGNLLLGTPQKLRHAIDYNEEEAKERLKTTNERIDELEGELDQLSLEEVEAEVSRSVWPLPNDYRLIEVTVRW